MYDTYVVHIPTYVNTVVMGNMYIFIVSHGKNCLEKKFENLILCCRNGKCVRCCGKVWWVLKKLNRELPYDPTIPPLVCTPKN